MRWLAAVFGWLVQLRNRLFDKKLLRIQRATAPVVCVGSIEVGGAGKTPLTMLLAKRLLARGIRVAILSRGYRGSLEGRGGRVEPTSEARDVGDEPLVLCRRLPEVPVYVGRRRARMAERAVAEGAQLLLMDDGFQHRRLARDLDVVILEGGRRWEELALLPAGPLREPIAPALGRAHLVVVRGVGPPPACWDGPMVRVEDEATGMRELPGGTVVGLDQLKDRQVSLVAGIARPERFARLARSLGAQVVEERFFGDHHPFTAGELTGLRAEILTTEKDAVRLPPGVTALVLEHRLRIEEGADVLDAALDRVTRAAE